MVIREAQSSLSFFKKINVFQVVYFPRGCNKVAHELAKVGAALNPESFQVWLEGFPEFVSDLWLAI